MHEHPASTSVTSTDGLARQSSDQAERTIRALVRELAELNQWEQRHFTRDELVAMLDEALNTQPASD